jgi:hypothetical protein
MRRRIAIAERSEFPASSLFATPQRRTAAQLRRRWCLLVGLSLLATTTGLVANNWALEALAAAELSLAAWRIPIESRAHAAKPDGSQLTGNDAEQLPPNDRSRSQDFVQHLPKAFAPDHLMAVIDRARLDHGVALGRVQLEPRPPEPGQLGAAELSFSLKGSYPSVKALLADLFARCPELTLARLNLRNANGAQEIDAEVSLRAWAQAAVSGEAGAAVRY